MKKKIEPQTYRERRHYERITAGFQKARELLNRHGRPIDFQSLGLGYLDTTLIPKGKQIGYIGGRDTIPNAIEGYIKNRCPNPSLIIQTSGDFRSNYHRNELFMGLGAKINLASKLEIDSENLSGILPTVEEGFGRNGGNGRGRRINPEDIRKAEEEYRNFLVELLEKAPKVRVLGLGPGFNDSYVVVDTDISFFIAYSPIYGNGTYIVENLEDLRTPKSELRRNGHAITFNRRGSNWREILRECFPNS